MGRTISEQAAVKDAVRHWQVIARTSKLLQQQESICAVTFSATWHCEHLVLKICEKYKTV